MRQILTIARLTFLLAVRNGMLWGLLVLAAGVAAFIFFVSTGDGVLVNELQLRVQYSYAISYSLLTLMIIATACFTVRSQIDGRQLHLVTSRPISRGRIWLGQWLGLLGSAAVIELALIMTLLGCAWGYGQSYTDEQTSEAKSFYSVIKHESHPVEIALKELTNLRIDNLVVAGKLDRGKVDLATWKRNYEKIQRADQLLAPGAEKSWQFDLGSKPTRGDAIDLKFRFYANDSRSLINGVWQLSAPGHPESYRWEFTVPPHQYITEQIPLSAIPASGQFKLTLLSQAESDIIIRRETGVRIYHAAGTLWHNVTKAFISQMIHLGVTAAVGLLAGIAFTFPVASFLAIVLYFLSISSGMFTDVLRDLTWGHDISLLERAGVVVIGSGLWLAKGLQPPGVAADASSAVSISLVRLSSDWLPGILVYGVAIGILGIWLLSRKELDKLTSGAA